MRTFQDRFDEVGGFGPGFDMVRLVLCYLVLVWHAWVLGVGSSAPGKSSLFWIPFEAMVPMFFALSGFLVAGSSLRLPTPTFLINRALRIVPALAAAVGVSALVIGPAFTVLPAADYLSAPAFRAYFLNIAGIVRYPLPGVFAGDAVNGSLWTVPWEIGCYLIMASLMTAGLARRAGLYIAIALAWLVVALAYWWWFPPEAAGFVHKVARRLLVSSGGLLIPYFLAGAALYHLRARVPWDARIAAVMMLALAAMSLFIDGAAWTKTPVMAALLLLPSVYLVPYLGLLPLQRPPGFRGGDYSYGVYVGHFPILQALLHSFSFAHWSLLLAAAFVPVTLLAMASWHLIESPVLAQRKRFSLVGRRIASGQD